MMPVSVAPFSQRRLPIGRLLRCGRVVSAVVQSRNYCRESCGNTGQGPLLIPSKLRVIASNSEAGILPSHGDCGQQHLADA